MSTTEVPKSVEAGHGISEEVVASRFPIVAEGTGKTAHNEGAKEKQVYNVRPNKRVPQLIMGEERQKRQTERAGN